jgi:adenylate kinase
MKGKPDRAAWLKGPAALCNIRPEPRPHRHRFVLLGAPGVGKGTQAELLAEHFDICPLSTGDVFRNAKSLPTQCECSPAMSEALGYMNAGELVPDETVISLIKERQKCLSCRGGYLLDGFPRTVAQAMALDKILEENGEQLDAVLSYELPL